MDTDAARIEAALVAYLQRLDRQMVTAIDLIPLVQAVCRAPHLAKQLLPKTAHKSYEATLKAVQLSLFEEEET